MVKIKTLQTILYEEHQLLLDRERCRRITNHYYGKKTIPNLVDYIFRHLEQGEWSSEESVSISEDDDDDMDVAVKGADRYDVYYIIEYVRRKCGLKLNERVVKHYIEQNLTTGKSSKEIAEFLVCPTNKKDAYYPEDYYHPFKDVQMLVDKQSQSILIKLLQKCPREQFHKYYIGEKTREIQDLITDNANRY